MLEMIIGIPIGVGILWVFGIVLNWLTTCDGRHYPADYFDGGAGSQGPLSG